MAQKETYQLRVREVTHWDDIVPNLDNKSVVVISWCDEEVCEDDITMVHHDDFFFSFLLSYQYRAIRRACSSLSAGSTSLCGPPSSLEGPSAWRAEKM